VKKKDLNRDSAGNRQQERGDTWTGKIVNDCGCKSTIHAMSSAAATAPTVVPTGGSVPSASTAAFVSSRYDSLIQLIAREVHQELEGDQTDEEGRESDEHSYEDNHLSPDERKESDSVTALQQSVRTSEIIERVMQKAAQWSSTNPHFHVSKECIPSCESQQSILTSSHLRLCSPKIAAGVSHRASEFKAAD
jgi:hypothetical protein